MGQEKILSNSLQLLTLAENLKMELRHSWLRNGRQESVAEHSWRLSLMVILFHGYLDQKVDVEKCLKMAIIHDLVEAQAGDIPIFEISERKELKKQNEEKAIESIKTILSSPIGDELYQLWHEFEAKESYEAKFINALDKLEVIIQHNHASLDTWIPWEYEYNTKGAESHCLFDSFILKISKMVQQQSREKISAKDKCNA